jgi:hypothetical protein
MALRWCILAKGVGKIAIGKVKVVAICLDITSFGVISQED